ncbi:MAG: hypothetical protein NZM26_02075 [Patescibacteria group bacterium]|nr:hypothetical protein [Patescibacteria group bacterium]
MEIGIDGIYLNYNNILNRKKDRVVASAGSVSLKVANAYVHWG